MGNLSEAARQFYLEQIGVRMWYARTPLPGAAPSPEFDFADPEPVDSAPAVSAPPSPQETDRAERAGKLAALQGMMTGETKPRQGAETNATAAEAIAEPAPDETKEPIVETSAPSSQPVRLNWGFWVGQEALLVSELADDASFQLQSALAENILKAIGQSARSSFRVRWPVFNNPLVPGSDRQTLSAIVRDQLKDHGKKRVILLGVLPRETADAREQLVNGIWEQVAIDLPNSLAALSTDPVGKRALWDALKPVFLPR